MAARPPVTMEGGAWEKTDWASTKSNRGCSPETEKFSVKENRGAFLATNSRDRLCSMPSSTS